MGEMCAGWGRRQHTGGAGAPLGGAWWTTAYKPDVDGPRMVWREGAGLVPAAAPCPLAFQWPVLSVDAGVRSVLRSTLSALNLTAPPPGQGRRSRDVDGFMAASHFVLNGERGGALFVPGNLSGKVRQTFIEDFRAGVYASLTENKTPISAAYCDLDFPTAVSPLGVLRVARTAHLAMCSLFPDGAPDLYRLVVCVGRSVKHGAPVTGMHLVWPTLLLDAPGMIVLAYTVRLALRRSLTPPTPPDPDDGRDETDAPDLHASISDAGGGGDAAPLPPAASPDLWNDIVDMQVYEPGRGLRMAYAPKLMRCRNAQCHARHARRTGGAKRRAPGRGGGGGTPLPGTPAPSPRSSASPASTLSAFSGGPARSMSTSLAASARSHGWASTFPTRCPHCMHGWMPDPSASLYLPFFALEGRETTHADPARGARVRCFRHCVTPSRSVAMPNLLALVTLRRPGIQEGTQGGRLATYMRQVPYEAWKAAGFLPGGVWAGASKRPFGRRKETLVAQAAFMHERDRPWTSARQGAPIEPNTLIWNALRAIVRSASPLYVGVTPTRMFTYVDDLSRVTMYHVYVTSSDAAARTCLNRGTDKPHRSSRVYFTVRPGAPGVQVRCACAKDRICKPSGLPCSQFQRTLMQLNPLQQTMLFPHEPVAGMTEDDDARRRVTRTEAQARALAASLKHADAVQAEVAQQALAAQRSAEETLLETLAVQAVQAVEAAEASKAAEAAGRPPLDASTHKPALHTPTLHRIEEERAADGAPRVICVSDAPDMPTLLRHLRAAQYPVAALDRMERHGVLRPPTPSS